MGTYLNPGNQGFERIVKSGYIDKTGLIGQVNQTIDTTQCLTCISRPRRFGKSYAAQMLCAYYDRLCDSRRLFSDYRIAGDPSFSEHLNKYDVIYIDMTGIKPYTDDYRRVVPFIIRRITDEICELYPGADRHEDFASTLIDAVNIGGNKIVMIIDEWDAPIRENPETQEEYLQFLRSIFKNSGVTAKVFAAVYMTGILPIKKDGTQSAISDFAEYTMIKPRMFAEYVGFTEDEVRSLCVKEHIDFAEMKAWYDGYSFEGVGSVYNPNSVMKAVRYGEFSSYWTESTAAEGLMEYIRKDYTGLSRTIAGLIGGVDAKISTEGFANDLTTFKDRDDVLTLLVHLGYLAYDAKTGTVYIPNEEIKREFQKSIHNVDHKATRERLEECEQLFYDTINMDEEAVAAQIEKIHMEETAPLYYNNETALRSVIKLAYYTYRDHYIQFEELPAGAGYADVVYIPRSGDGWPALLIELKWNKSASGAIEQCINRKYPSALRGIGADILLVGINYDKDAPAGSRRHSCRIEKLESTAASEEV